MKLVIDIPEEDIPKVQGTMEIHLSFCNGKLCQCDYPFETEYCKDAEVDLVKFDTPYTDTISRQAAIDAMREETCMSCWDAKDILKHLPTDSAEKAGRWEKTIYRSVDQTGETYDDGDALRCSECAHCFKTELLWVKNYCPNCGAKMEV